MRGENLEDGLATDHGAVITVEPLRTVPLDETSASEKTADKSYTSAPTGRSRPRPAVQSGQVKKRDRHELLPEKSTDGPLQTFVDSSIETQMNPHTSILDVTISSQVSAPTQPPSSYLDWRNFPRPGWNSYPLDWRWRLATHLALDGEKPVGFQTIDADVKGALAHLRSSSPQSPDDTALPDTLRTGVAEAVCLGKTGGLQRAEIEARILAREDVAAIAAKTGIAPATISTFASLFFDIACREKTGILFHLVFPSIHTVGHVTDTGTLLKLAGYAGGPFVVDALLNFLAKPAPVIPKNLGTATDEALKQIEDWLTIRSWILTQTVSTDTDVERLRFEAIYQELILKPE